MLLPKSKNRNKKGLLLGSEAAKPGTTFSTSSPSASSTASNTSHRPPPIQVIPSRPSSQLAFESSPTTPSSFLSASSTSTASKRSSYHNKLSEQLATLELGVEFKLDLRNEDLEVLGELGSGNGGTVTKAKHVPTGIVMAKKVVHIATSPPVRKQILRELQIMHDCSSPFIVSFYGAYLADPHVCMCIEFMDKGSLDNIYRKVGPIPEPILGKIALAVVSGLMYLYEVHKIMHRDVKPSNILMNSKGDIKICDFGVSGELINSVADTFVGTSTYMSPERISGDPYTVKSDVWSLGITLIELAIGRSPFTPSPDSPPHSDGDDDSDLEEFSQLSLSGVAEEEFQGEEEEEDEEVGEETLSPVRPGKKGESVEKAERRRQERLVEKARSRTSSLSSATTPISSMSSSSAGVGAGGAPRLRNTSTTSSSAGSGSGSRSSGGKRRSTSGRPSGGGGGGGGNGGGGGGAADVHHMSILELLQYIVNEPAPKLPSGKFGREVEEFVEATVRKEPVGWDVRKKGPLAKGVARPTPKELMEYPWMIHSAEADTDVEAFARSIP